MQVLSQLARALKFSLGTKTNVLCFHGLRVPGAGEKNNDSLSKMAKGTLHPDRWQLGASRKKKFNLPGS